MLEFDETVEWAAAVFTLLLVLALKLDVDAVLERCGCWARGLGQAAPMGGVS